MFTFTVEFPPPEVCRQITLSASRTYGGKDDSDPENRQAQFGYQVLAPAMRFAIPAEVPVVGGKPGLFKTTFTWSLAGQESLCQYVGNGTNKYLLSFCSDGSTAGNLVQADRVKLHLPEWGPRRRHDQGEARAGRGFPLPRHAQLS